MPTLRVINKTGYDTSDLSRFFARGLWAMGCRKDKIIRVLPTRGDSRGVANVGMCRHNERGECERKGLVLFLPPPEQLTIRRLSRLFEHEVRHTKGETHEEMSEAVYWSSQPTVPVWARGMTIRYRFGQHLHSPSFDEREGKRLERELAKIPERSPDPLEAYLAPRGLAPGVGPERGQTPVTGIARYVSPHGSVRYVLYEQSRPLAALQVVTRDKKHATIANVYTLPSRRKEGLARALLARARRDFQTVSHASEENISPAGKAWRARVGSPLRRMR
jgi:predicted GNAT family acetyltransferase